MSESYTADEIRRAARAAYREVPAPRWVDDLIRRLRAGEGAPPPEVVPVSETDRAAARAVAREAGLFVRSSRGR